MVMTIELSADEEARIRALAARAGVSPEEFVRRRATRPTSRKRASANGLKQADAGGQAKPAGAELWDELEAAGVLTGYGDPSVDSVELARQLSETFSRSSGDQ